MLRNHTEPETSWTVRASQGPTHGLTDSGGLRVGLRRGHCGPEAVQQQCREASYEMLGPAGRG